MLLGEHKVRPYKLMFFECNSIIAFNRKPKTVFIMSAAIKKPIAGDYVEVKFRIPATKVVEVKEVLASYGAMAPEPESMPWEEVYPDFNGSVALRGARKREGLTQKELAGLVGVSQTHISEMEHGKRPIGKDMARRLAKVLKADYRVFL
jgi:DNA-binding XRE family transcriptional regulator